MTVIAPAPSMRVEPHVDGAHSFLVTRRERSSGRYERLGVLTEVSDGWDFRYFRDVFQNERTIALPGIPLTDSVIHSEHLFPLFAQRVVSPRRPDRPRILAMLGLDESATAFEILAHNGGRRLGDTIELIQLPRTHQGGGESMQFLVHGMRYRSEAEQSAVDALAVGDELLLVPEPDNPVDTGALLVVTTVGAALGWVPAPLLPLLVAGAEMTASVAHVNSSQAPPHQRLLVELRGDLAVPEVFSSPSWRLVD